MNIPAMKALARQLMLDPPIYEQGKSFGLRVTTVQHSRHFVAYSLLGVMADIYRRACDKGLVPINTHPKWESSGQLDVLDIFTFENPPYGRERWRMDIPDCVHQWYGITRERATHLILLQMSGYTFKQIGKAIEKAVEEYQKKGRAA